MNQTANSTSAANRLGSTLFAVAMIHGLLVLGVTFAPERDSGGVPTVEVVMLSDPDESPRPAEDAEYLAQASQLGSGTTRETVSPGSGRLQPFAAEGDPNGTDLLDSQSAPAASSDPVVAARAADQAQVQIDPETRRQPDERTRTAARLDPSDALALAELETDPEPQITGPDARELFVAVNTRQSDVAEYLARWKDKVERLGTLNFPRSVGQGRTGGNPTLEVALRADGSIEEIVVLRSSGRTDVDQAAMRILRMAAPFEPFPRGLRNNYQVLRFAYEWRFQGGNLSPGSLKIGSTTPAR